MLSEAQRETYEKILLANTVKGKMDIVERELHGDDQKKLKFWFKLSQGQAKKDWSSDEKKEYDRMYSYGVKEHLDNIDLLLRYETAKNEA